MTPALHLLLMSVTLGTELPSSDNELPVYLERLRTPYLHSPFSVAVDSGDEDIVFLVPKLYAKGEP